MLISKDQHRLRKETGAEHLYYWGGEYGQDNLRRVEPPQARRHFGAWSRGQTDIPGRPSQIIVRETGEWGMEWANFGGGTAYVFIDDEAGLGLLLLREIVVAADYDRSIK